MHQHAGNAHVSGDEERYSDNHVMTDSEDEHTNENPEGMNDGDSGIQEVRGLADGDEASSQASDNISLNKELATDGASDVTTHSDAESVSTDGGGGETLPPIKMMKVPVEDDVVVHMRNLHNVGSFTQLNMFHCGGGQSELNPQPCNTTPQ